MSWFQRNFKSSKRRKEIRKQNAQAVLSADGWTQQEIDADFYKNERILRHENQRKTRIGVAALAATVLTAGVAAPALAGVSAGTIATGIGTAATIAGGVSKLAVTGKQTYDNLKGGAPPVSTSQTIPTPGGGGIGGMLAPLAAIAALVFLKR
jgi:hypothetical protein